MTPDHDGEIAERAYRIWEREGKPTGKELEHWLRAEAEIKARHNGAPSEAPAAKEHPDPPPAAPVKPQRPAPQRARRIQKQN